MNVAHGPATIENPWRSLPELAPFILDFDRKVIEAYNEREGAQHRYAVRYGPFPEPFLGRPEAPLVLLNGNPGSIPERDSESMPYYEPSHPMMTIARRNLLHEVLPYPFWTLDPAFNGFPGYKWWARKLKALIETCGQQTVAKRTLCVEYFPYHSKNFAHFPLLNSQKYSIQLVRHAIDQSRVILRMRSHKLWLQAIPELSNYPHFYTLKNPQNVSISPGNMSHLAWDAVCAAVSMETK